MDLIAMIAEYGAWSWIVGGLVLLGIELMVPGGVVVWLGGAAIVTGLVTLLTSMSWPFQWAVFGVLSVGALAGWLALKKRAPTETDSPFLNKRADRLVGKEGFLSEAIVGQKGRMEVGDGVWRVSGPDLPVGHRVRVVGHSGTLLNVESAETKSAETD